MLQVLLKKQQYCPKLLLKRYVAIHASHDGAESARQVGLERELAHLRVKCSILPGED